MTSLPRARFFRTPAAFRQWLDRHHGSASELWVGFYKKGSGRGGLTVLEAVCEALCFGWIDGRLQPLDEERYSVRFTPRRPRSNWSAVNLRRADELIRAGRMHAAGLQAYEARTRTPAGYSFEEREKAVLAPDAQGKFERHPRAWQFFQAQPPGYRRTASWWVVSAKREETRARRLERLIADSEAGRRLGLLGQSAAAQPDRSASGRPPAKPPRRG